MGDDNRGPTHKGRFARTLDRGFRFGIGIGSGIIGDDNAPVSNGSALSAGG
jgi:hypothetical protein